MAVDVHDRMGTDALPLTQEFLAQMLGTRRASVSVAASILQRAGLINYARGHVTILNRPGLEEATCECYGVMRRQLESWQAETPMARGTELGRSIPRTAQRELRVTQEANRDKSEE